jgi:hypothetical protein
MGTNARSASGRHFAGIVVGINPDGMYLVQFDEYKDKARPRELKYPIEQSVAFAGSGRSCVQSVSGLRHGLLCRHIRVPKWKVAEDKKASAPTPASAEQPQPKPAEAKPAEAKPAEAKPAEATAAAAGPKTEESRAPAAAGASPNPSEARAPVGKVATPLAPASTSTAEPVAATAAAGAASIQVI